MKEDATKETGVTIDSAARDITVEVTDDGNGKLVAEVTGGAVEDLTFVNTYKSSQAKVQFKGLKTLTGKKLEDAEFSFTLYDGDGEKIETVRNDGKGKIVFEEIIYDETGTYKYQVKEDATNVEGVSIDSTVYNITVKVTDGGKGKLKASVTGADINALNFTNHFNGRVRTGDDTPLMMWMLILAVSAAAIVLLLKRRKAA